jgi:predicted nucleotidyltransferase component of viral defense system
MTQKRNTKSPASILQRLRNACVPGQTVKNAQILFVLERFLARVAGSQYQDRLVLKGGILLYLMLGQWVRPTEDLDFLALRIPGEAMEQVLRDILAVDAEDGLQFDGAAITWEDIREDTGYPCRRFTIPYRFGDKHAHFIKLDLSFGDPVTPGPRPFEVHPILADFPGGMVLGYPTETLLAEKIETLVVRGLANTRSKDIFDIWVLSRTQQGLQLGATAAALAATATYRHTQLDPGCSALGSGFLSDTRQNQLWNAYVRSRSLVVPNFPEVMGRVQVFSKPVVGHVLQPGADAMWNPAASQWG